MFSSIKDFFETVQEFYKLTGEEPKPASMRMTHLLTFCNQSGYHELDYQPHTVIPCQPTPSKMVAKPNFFIWCDKFKIPLPCCRVRNSKNFERKKHFDFCTLSRSACPGGTNFLFWWDRSKLPFAYCRARISKIFERKKSFDFHTLSRSACPGGTNFLFWWDMSKLPLVCCRA